MLSVFRSVGVHGVASCDWGATDSVAQAGKHCRDTATVSKQ